ncbi:hypothetical protein IE077_000121 [Cardiosporidium cionae]|uniref:Uncharacterized protein n=1 Tax=Cardiosporidium cionae TaxID=476202 RepID=A0ABQ7J5L4_9APIC|nr:hypothetical protein IE077_000121 [Cardiosporidium cionae]|eukprot:KAF8819282.1 hypothetical protein IE077_000121 [Cardiosporidium cionae]
MLRLSSTLFGRIKSGWTYKLRRYRTPVRWNLPRWLTKTEYKTPKFGRPGSLTSVVESEIVTREKLDPAYKNKTAAWAD